MLQNLQPCLWSAEDGRRIGTYEGHNGAIWTCEFTCKQLGWKRSVQSPNRQQWALRSMEVSVSVDHAATLTCACRGFGPAHNGVGRPDHPHLGACLWQGAVSISAQRAVPRSEAVSRRAVPGSNNGCLHGGACVRRPHLLAHTRTPPPVHEAPAHLFPLSRTSIPPSSRAPRSLPP